LPIMNSNTYTTRDAFASWTSRHALKSFPYSWSSILAILVFAYPLLASKLRFRRIDAVHQKRGYSTRDSMAKMTDTEAHEILKLISDVEFPTMFEKGLQLALFRSMLFLCDHLDLELTTHSLWYPKHFRAIGQNDTAHHG
jgi:hypothetical protein